jgi:hypothetical protein
MALFAARMRNSSRLLGSSSSSSSSSSRGSKQARTTCLGRPVVFCAAHWTDESSWRCKAHTH